MIYASLHTKLSHHHHQKDRLRNRPQNHRQNHLNNLESYNDILATAPIIANTHTSV